MSTTITINGKKWTFDGTDVEPRWQFREQSRSDEAAEITAAVEAGRAEAYLHAQTAALAPIGQQS